MATRYRITFSVGILAKEKTIWIEGDDVARNGEIDRDEVLKMVRRARVQLELDYGMRYELGEKVLKVERALPGQTHYHELVLASEAKPGTRMVVWGSCAQGPSYRQIEVGRWVPQGDGTCRLFSKDGINLGVYVAQAVFQVLAPNAAV